MCPEIVLIAMTPVGNMIVSRVQFVSPSEHIGVCTVLTVGLSDHNPMKKKSQFLCLDLLSHSVLQVMSLVVCVNVMVHAYLISCPCSNKICIGLMAVTASYLCF